MIEELVGLVDIEPMMLSDDFSYYQEAVSRIFSFLGTKNTELGYTAALRNSKFNFYEKVLVKGFEYYMNIFKKINLI